MQRTISLTEPVTHLGAHCQWDRWGESEDVAHVFAFLNSIIICWLYKLTHSHQTQVTLQLRVILSDLVFNWSAIAGGLEKYFHSVLNALSAAPWEIWEVHTKF